MPACWGGGACLQRIPAVYSAQLRRCCRPPRVRRKAQLRVLYPSPAQYQVSKRAPIRACTPDRHAAFAAGLAWRAAARTRPHALARARHACTPRATRCTPRTMRRPLPRPLPSPPPYPQAALATVAQITGVTTMLLMATSKYVFRYGGWVTAAMATPTAMLISGIVFFASAIAMTGYAAGLGPEVRRRACGCVHTRPCPAPAQPRCSAPRVCRAPAAPCTPPPPAPHSAPPQPPTRAPPHPRAPTCAPPTRAPPTRAHHPPALPRRRPWPR